MKMKMLIIMCYLLCSHAALSQMVFAPVGTVWHYEYLPDLAPRTGLNYTRQEVIKDTVFEGKLCSKITGKKISINAAENGYDTLMLPAQYVYTSDDTVFYYNHNFSHFYPLYIYNVKVGDTVEYHVPYLRPPSPDTTFKVVVTGVEEVVIGGRTLRKVRHTAYYSSAFTMHALIERLGADGQSVIGYMHSPRHPDFHFIRCYSDKDMNVNIGPYGYECDGIALPLGLKEDARKPGMKIFPNPAGNEIYLECPSDRGTQYRIRDIVGRAYNTPRQASGNKVSFNIQGLPSGIYWLQVQTNDGELKTLKFLKTGE